MSRVLDGKWVRDAILTESKPRVAALAASVRAPGLAVVLVGHDAGSEIYVRNKVRACEELGIYSEKHTPQRVDEYGRTTGVDPIPERTGRDRRNPGPDAASPAYRFQESAAGGQAGQGCGRLPSDESRFAGGEPAGPRACTPSGIIQLLDRYDIPIEGKHAVVVGRSEIVGKPMALLLLHRNATVTICHSRTPDLANECRRADILVAAIGRPALIRGDFIRPGATVVDVGMNRLTQDEAAALFGGEKPRTVVGDVHPLEVAEAAGAYTPVPGGVGPLTVAMLMVNTIDACERHVRCFVSA